MAYSTQADILEQLDEAQLIRLTDPDGLAVDEDVVTRAIADADATIDAHCQGRYSIPLSPVSGKVRQVSVDIAIYNLFSRRGDSMPDVRKDRHKEAIRFLEAVRDDKIKLGAATPAATNTRDTVEVSSNERVFDRDSMDGF